MVDDSQEMLSDTIKEIIEEYDDPTDLQCVWEIINTVQVWDTVEMFLDLEVPSVH